MQIKLIRVTTVPVSLHKLIKGQPNFMKKKGFEVQLLSAKGKEAELIKKDTGIDVKTFPYTRKISPITDIKALWLTYKYFNKEKPKIVHTHTPKAGIVGMLAARLANVPIRMHTVAGLPLIETHGLKRKLLNIVEKLTSWGATNIYPNSFALMNFMAENKLAPLNKLKVIGNGSSNGINTEEFSLKNVDFFKFNRKKLNINEDDIVFCFVGRIVKDKGINELLAAFDRLNNENKKIKLLLVGEEEKLLDPVNKLSKRVLSNNSNIIQLGWQEDVKPFLAISDIFVFPSYREGFPNVVMQAGAMELPSIVSDINGCNEIIEEGINGLIIQTKNEKQLFEKMKILVNDKQLRIKLSGPTRDIIKKKYSQEYIWEKLYKEYINLLSSRKIDYSSLKNEN
ncbi:MAG: glycosyltransferase family 4 protein [Bacteroidota bacterium]